MLLAKSSVIFPSGSNPVKKLHYALGWIIEYFFLMPTYMICLLDQFLALCKYDCGLASTPVLVGLPIFVAYLETEKGLPGSNFSKCVCIYVGLSYIVYKQRFTPR